MKKQKTIDVKNLPAKLPIWSSIMCAMALDYWSAPEWLIGGVGLFFVFGWIFAISKMITQEKTDIFSKGGIVEDSE